MKNIKKIKKLNLGSGNTKSKNYIDIDIDKKCKPDVVLDLEKAKLPYRTNTIDEIYTSHTLEHIVNLIPLLEECWRVLKPKGIFRILVPSRMSPGGRSIRDLTHVREFIKESFFHLDKGDPLGKIYNWNLDFKILSNREYDSGDIKEIDVKMEAIKPKRK